MTEELSPEARALLNSARGADDPSPADRARLRTKVLAAATGAGAAMAGGASASAATAAASTGAVTGAATLGVVAKSVAAVIFVGASVTGAVHWSGQDRGELRDEASSEVSGSPAELAQQEPPTEPTSAPQSPDGPVVPLVAEVPEAPPADPGAAPEATPNAPERRRASGPATSTPPVPETTTEVEAARDPLADELQLLRAAQRHRASGRFRDALREIARHEAQFPAGVLLEEREGTRAMTLCELGDERASETARAFVARFPQSPLRARVTSACDRGPLAP